MSLSAQLTTSFLQNYLMSLTNLYTSALQRVSLHLAKGDCVYVKHLQWSSVQKVMFAESIP